MYTVRDVMSSPVLTIAPDAAVNAAMHEMKRRDISSLIVPMPHGGYGIVTRRDVVGKVVAAGLDPQHMRVVDICTAPVVTIGPDTSLRECSARMMDLKVRRLPVVDAQHNLLGMITETDIFMAVEERGWGPDELGESKLRSIGALARIRRMTVAEVMSRPVAMIASDASVSDALARMAERGISSLVVQPPHGTTVYGIVTKRDIIGKVVARNHDPQALRVAEIMSSPIYTIAPHVTLPQCATRMVALGVRRLTVTEGEQPVGIISDTDIFRAVEGRRISPVERAQAAPRAPIRHITKSHVHTAADVMGREALYVNADATVSAALALMEAQNVESLLVRPAAGGAIGIVTQRDIVSQVVAQERDPDTLTVGEISSSPLTTVAPNTSINDCSELMTRRNIRRLPVQAGADIIGIVRDTDIFAAVEERGWEAEVSHQSAVASNQTASEKVESEKKRTLSQATRKPAPRKPASKRKAVVKKKRSKGL